MPYRNAVGMIYDSGRYQENMDWAMALADWNGFERRRREAAKRGKLLGRGLANYIESSIGAPIEQPKSCSPRCQSHSASASSRR